MDISSTTSSTMSTADTSASAKSQSSSKSDSSFKDEMSKVEKNEDTKNASEAESKSEPENKQDSKVEDNSSNPKKDDDSPKQDFDQFEMLNGEISLSQTAPMGLKSQLSSDNFQTLIDANQQLANVTMMAGMNNISTKVDYNTVQMDSNDAKFFSDLVQNPDKTLQNVVADLQGGIEQTVQEASKNVKVSATLMNALSEAVKNNQSFRIDFDKDISVIIKVDKDGALSAKFIPGDKAVEEYLKQNMSYLRQRFDEQELSYKDLSYSRQQQRQQNRRNNKENNHE